MVEYRATANSSALNGKATTSRTALTNTVLKDARKGWWIRLFIGVQPKKIQTGPIIDAGITARNLKSPPVAAPFIQRPPIKLLPTINCNNLHALVPEFSADGQARRTIDGALNFG